MTSTGRKVKKIPRNLWRILQRSERLRKNITVVWYRRRDGVPFRRMWTSSFTSIRRVGSRILEKERWKVFDSIQRWHVDCRVFISHNNPANHFSIYGAFLELCNEFFQQIFAQSISSIEKSEQWDCQLAVEDVNNMMMLEHGDLDCVITKINSNIFRKR